MGTTNLTQLADQLVSSAKYQEALPYLDELYTRLENSETVQAVAAKEKIIYFLGVANMVTGNQPEAIHYLEIYLEKYKGTNIRREVDAQEMLAEIYFKTQQFEKAGEHYLSLINSRHVTNDRKRTAKLQQIDSYVMTKNWEQLIAVAGAFVVDSRDGELQGRAATALCQAYVETNQPSKVFELIPVLENNSSTARYQTDFNLTMIRAGDKMFQAQKFDMALPLYQIAAPKRLIERWINGRMEELKSRQDALVTTRPVPRNYAMLFASLSGELQRLQENKEKLGNVESYDEELRTRLAQTFFRQGRKWEALWLYESLMDDFPESSQGDKAGYAAFALAAELGQRDRAIQLGRAYLDQFPKGESFDILTWQLTQMLVAAREWGAVREMVTTMLLERPDHIFADKLLFLTGYSLFQEEEFEKAAEIFSRIRKDYPQSESREKADFWHAMTILYRSDYQMASDQFRLFAETYPEGDFHEDAVFRTGVCAYALEKYGEARKIFTDFTTKYPDAPQGAEAHMLLGDIAGNDSRLEDAKGHYEKVALLTINQGNIDYAAMAEGRVLEALERWDEMISWFTSYLDTYGTSGLYAEAIYRIGFAKKQKGDVEGMLATYLDAIKRYGNDPNAIGIDLITRDWPPEYQAHHGKSSEAIIDQELAEARTREEATAELRWLMMKDLMHPDAPIDLGTKEIGEEELKSASPAVLVWLGDRAVKSGDANLARKAYADTLARFSENEWYLPALMALARMDTAEGNADDAIKHYERVRELFPSTDSAADALYEQATLLAEQKKYPVAIMLLEMILDVKEWRGENWARALYTIGTLLQEQGKDQEAFAYYQRVYVLYSAYRDWTAKAYLASAQCLAVLGKQEERTNTLKEMVSNESLSTQPEYDEAKKELSKN